jgi:hypothetical protein
VATLAVDLRGDNPPPVTTTVLGVWCGVAVVDLSYVVTSGGSALADVVRGMDVATGQLLWSLDATADGSRLMVVDQAVFGWENKLALASEGLFPVAGSTDQWCAVGTDVMVLDIRSGAALARSRFDTGCRPLGGEPAARVLAYHDAVVVVASAQAVGMEDQVVTQAFRDTDLDQALWTDLAGGSGQWLWGTDPVLPGGWVQTAQGSYVGLADGAPAPFDGLAADQLAWRGFYGAGEWILEARGAFDTMVNQQSGWLNTLAGWRADSVGGPAWTYTPAEGWRMALGAYPDHSPTVAVTDDVVVVLELRYEVGWIAAARLTALGLADGAPRWSAPYDVPEDGQTSVCVSFDSIWPGGVPPEGEPPGDLTSLCWSTATPGAAGVVRNGGREFLVYTATGAVTVVDMASGALVGGGPIDGLASLVHQCGAAGCLLVDTAGASPSLVTVEVPSATTLRSEAVRPLRGPLDRDAAYPLPNGLLLVAVVGQQRYFMIA